jgi:hypothetical protein
MKHIWNLNLFKILCSTDVTFYPQRQTTKQHQEKNSTSVQNFFIKSVYRLVQNGNEILNNSDFLETKATGSEKCWEPVSSSAAVAPVLRVPELGSSSSEVWPPPRSCTPLLLLSLGNELFVLCYKLLDFFYKFSSYPACWLQLYL